MFPLHLNSFNRLFSEVINPKLSALISSVKLFVCLNSDICKFISSLFYVYNNLNVSPAQELLRLIGKFNGGTHAQQARSDINKMIEQLDNLSVKSKYEEIIQSVQSLAKQYNQGLKTEYESFNNKIQEHKKSLEQNIKKYIENIKTCLKEHSSCVEKFIESIKKIESEIKNFDSNFRQIGHISGYKTPLEIMKTGQSIRDVEIKQIFVTLSKYRSDSRSFNFKKSTLSGIIRQLEFYSKQFINEKVKYEESSSGSSIIDRVLNPLELFKAQVDRFIKHIQYVEKLEEIGEHIKHMKALIPKVKGKVKDQVKDYIEGLADIKINANEVQKDINNIKEMNNFLVVKLGIAKHTINFYKSLEKEILKLNGVTFSKYNIDEFYTNSALIQQKLTSFDKAIKQAISKIKQDMESIKIDNHTIVVQGDTYTESYYKNLISPVETFIDNSIKRIKIMEHILQVLQQILELECAIEGVARNLIRCSLQSCVESTGVNVISPSSHIIDSMYNNIIYVMSMCVLFRSHKDD